MARAKEDGQEEEDIRDYLKKVARRRIGGPPPVFKIGRSNGRISPFRNEEEREQTKVVAHENGVAELDGGGDADEVGSGHEAAEPVCDLGDFAEVFAYLSITRPRLAPSPNSRDRSSWSRSTKTTGVQDESSVIKATDFAYSGTPAPKEPQKDGATLKKRKKKRVRLQAQADTVYEQSDTVQPEAGRSVDTRHSSARKPTSNGLYVSPQNTRMVRTSSVSDSSATHLAPRPQPQQVPEIEYQTYGLPLDGPTKSSSLMTKISVLFPSEHLYRSRNIFLPNPPSSPTSSPFRPLECSVFVFIDHSNIHLGFLHYLKAHYPGLDLSKFKRARPGKQEADSRSRRPRLDYDSLFAVLERGRSVVHRYLAASRPLYQHLDVAVVRGYEVQLMERVLRPDPVAAGAGNPIVQPARSSFQRLIRQASNESESEGAGGSSGGSTRHVERQLLRLREQGLDEIIQLAIVDAVEDFDWRRESGDEKRPRPILVLASGDANAGEYSKAGFRGRVTRCLRDGWDVEVFGWRGSISRWYFEEQRWTSGLADDVSRPGVLKVVCLDEFAEELLADEA